MADSLGSHSELQWERLNDMENIKNFKESCVRKSEIFDKEDAEHGAPVII